MRTKTAAAPRIRYAEGIPLPRVSDGRRPEARRYRALVLAYANEFGGRLTEVDKGLIQQAAALALQVEGLQRNLVEGQPVDADSIIRLSSEHRRILSSLRTRTTRSKPAASQTLQDYLASKYPQQTSDEAAAS